MCYVRVFNFSTDTCLYFCLSILRQPYGEVDINFARQFNHELGKIWTLVDVYSNKHNVRYIKSSLKPEITDGWAKLRSFYRMTGDHMIFLRYLGDNTIQITVFKTPSTPKSFPRYHSRYPRESESENRANCIPHHERTDNNVAGDVVSFSISLTQYKATGS